MNSLYQSLSSPSSSQPKHAMKTAYTTSNRFLNALLPLTIYLLSLSIYLHPLVVSPTPSEFPISTTTNKKYRWNLITRPKPQSDEIHILDPDNRDVSPPSSCHRKNNEEDASCPSWKNAWYNDYWGRPLDSPSSHKSWRPVSVWSFRFLKGGGETGRRIIGWIGRCFALTAETILSMFGRRDPDIDAPDVHEHANLPASELFVHRFVNVWIHACIVQLIGVASALLFPSSPDDPPQTTDVCARHLSRLLFAIHPAHVEAVANAANRPHLLGLLFNALVVDPSFPLAGVPLSSGMGLLCAETALFQSPAVVCTMTAVRYAELLRERRRRKRRETDDDEEESKHESLLRRTLLSLMPRYALLLLTDVVYLLYRHHKDTLNIPPGLIRPAENPYYNKVGTTWSTARRIMNYSYVTALHVLKSWGVELVGFSHEYGYDCVPELRVGVLSDDGVGVVDLRLALPIGLMLGFVGVSVWCWYGRGIGGRSSSSFSSSPSSSTSPARREVRQHAEDRTMRMLLLLVFLSWMATLFPIAGILKVGTFVADRIVVPSTFGTCIFGGRLLALWIVEREPKESDNVIHPSRRKRQAMTKQIAKTIFVLGIGTRYLALRTHRRVADWMDSVPLLESSVRACPRSIKSNLEMSKLYSGLVPHMVDLEKALRLIETAQKIDPTYCDVHQQFGHVYFQQGKFIQFEKEMVESLLCPFTMGQAMGNWKKYWNAVLAPRNGKTDAAARKRYDKYMKILEESIDREAEKAGMEDNERRIRHASNLEDEL
ncbi:hypothetical protein ACHAW6_005367 [Cyclotella cf. meneghiniana]